MKKLLIILGIVVGAYTLFGIGYAVNEYTKPTVTHTQAVQQPEVVKLNADTIFNLVNEQRAKAGVKPLVRDTRLDATAQSRADDMVARNYFSHYDPIDGHKMVNDPTNLAQYNTICYSSENLSAYWQSDAQVVSGWMGSEPHKNAILNADYDIAGLAVSGTKVTQHFCNLK